MVLSVDICYFPVQFCELHIVLIELVVVDHLIDLLHPLVIHEQLVVAIGDSLLSCYELRVLGL